MSRTLFENSKSALAFAGMTLFGAIAMVGTADNDGVLALVADRLAEQAPDNPNGGPAQTAAPAPTDTAVQSSQVFGTYEAVPSSSDIVIVTPATPDEVSTPPPVPGSGRNEPSQNVY